jgi:hypothetical protein
VNPNLEELVLYKDRILFTLRWNWGGLLAFVLIWSYGFENVTFPLDSVKGKILTFILGILVFLLVLIGEVYKDEFQEHIQLRYQDGLVFLGLLLVFVGFGWQNLTTALVGDQLYHAQASQSQTIQAVDALILSLSLDDALPYKQIARGVNLVFLATTFLALYLLKNSKPASRAVWAALFFWLLRLFTANSYSDPHPPFRLFPLWLNSIVFGLNDFAFRSISLFALVFFVFVLYRLGREKLGKVNSLLLALSVGTIPLLWHVASVVEQSIWTALSWSLLLMFIDDETRNPKYIRWISIISIAGLMRASAFVGLVPVALLLVWQFLKSRDMKSVRIYLIYTIPVLVLLPFLIKTLVVGTPSTSGHEADTLSKLLLSFNDFFSLRMLYYHIQLPWVIFLPMFLFVVFKDRLKALVYFVFFGAAYAIFYTIWPQLWGVPRYQAELGVPFAILGFYTVFSFLYRKFPVYNRHLGFLLSLAIVYNIVVYTNLNWFSAPVDAWSSYFTEVKTGRVRILSEGEGVFNVNEALRQARQEGFSHSMCKAGITYGTFSEIMNGYSVGEMSSMRYNFPLCATGGPFDISEINEFKNIRLILFVDKHNKQSEVQKFIDSGQWVLWRQFYNEKFGSTIIGIERKE